MATDNQLRARIQPSHAEYISTIANERFDGVETEAERKVVEEGLAALGYDARPYKAHEILLWYVRRMGLVLGFVGLILMGYGIFGPRLYSVIGFGLVVGGFLLVALSEGLDVWTAQNGGELE